jgi:hypothetical protein
MVGKPEVWNSAHQAEQSAIYASSAWLATNPPLFPGRLQLPIPLGMDLLLTPAGVQYPRIWCCYSRTDHHRCFSATVQFHMGGDFRASDGVSSQPGVDVTLLTPP